MRNTHWETLAGLIRVYAPGRGYPGPFEFQVTIVGDGDTAIVKGLVTEQYSREVRDSIAARLREKEFKRARWHRKKPDGREVTIEVNLGE